jgi:hypothetical protein
MPESGIRVDPEALTAYRDQMTRLAEELAEVGTGTLAPANGLPGDCFGKLSEEVGLSGAFGSAASAQTRGIAAASAGLGGLAKAVGDALVAYQQQDQDSGAAIRRAGQV